MSRAEDFDNFFEEMFHSDTTPYPSDDPDNFLKKLHDSINSLSDITDEFNSKHSKWMKEFKIFERNFFEIAKQNHQMIENIKEIGNILNKDVNLENLFFSFYPDEKKVSKWFGIFLSKKSKKFKSQLNDYTNKLYKTLFPAEFLNSRQKVFSDVQTQINKAREYFIDDENIDPLYILILNDVIKGVSELKMYDDSIKDFLVQIYKKIGNYIMDVKQDYLNFKVNAKKSEERFLQFTLENDDSFAGFLNNIDKEPHDTIRIKKYNIELTNYDLSTLKAGRFLDEKMMQFFAEFYNEKNNKCTYEKKIMVNPYKFFESLMPPGQEVSCARINYNSVKAETDRYRGKNKTIFDFFDKIVTIISLTDSNWLLVEINNKTYEIIIYDPQFYFYGNEHEKIIDIFRIYMIEELKSKGEVTEEEGLNIERRYIGRSGMCPQIMNACDSGILSLMNLKNIMEGRVGVGKRMANGKEVNRLRNEMFGLIMRLKNEGE